MSTPPTPPRQPPNRPPAALDPGRREAILTGAIGALLELPRRIDRYLVRGELGRGGMGVVYDAIDPQLERPVAIKVINPALLAGSESRAGLEARFEREMRAVSPIFHPNVVTILDAGIASVDGVRVAYYVMERVSGESLEDRIRRSGPPDADEALAIAAGVARGLGALHARGLVHRDVKPSNVLLPVDRSGGTLPIPKVSDFGLVHLIDEAGIAGEESVLAGSTHGLAPEQIHSRTVDDRTDLFALGALIVRLFSGEEPFGASRLSERLHRIEFDQPDGIDALPREVASLVRSLLAKRPTERPESADAVARRLEAIRRRGRWGGRIGKGVVAIAGCVVASWLGYCEWRGDQIERAIEREERQHAAAIARQVERAEILSSGALTAMLTPDLPADERRAHADRLEGVANRIAYERRHHAEAIAAWRARLDGLRPFRPSRWLEASAPGEIDAPALAHVDAGTAARSAPREADGPSSEGRRVVDPGHRLAAAERAELLEQIDLLAREFALRVDVQIDADLQPPGRLEPIELDAARDSLAPLRLRVSLDLVGERAAGVIEASPALEPLLPDALLGALLREQILPLAARGETALGLRLGFRVVRERLRSAFAGTEQDATRGSTDGLDPHLIAPIPSRAPGPGRFAGAGAEADFDLHRDRARLALEGQLDEAERSRLAAGASVDETWRRFDHWLSLETLDAEVGLFTRASREILRGWPASRPYWRSIRRDLATPEHVTIERGDRALLYTPARPEIPPSFFRRTRVGWQLDLAAQRTHLLGIAGDQRHWTFRDVEGEGLVAFGDDLVVQDGLIRLAPRP